VQSRVGRYDFLGHYVDDLPSIVDLAMIRKSGVRIGVDPMGGASVDYWGAIAERYRLDLTVTNTTVDPTFGFMTVDWDGKIRMDPSSPYAMAGWSSFATGSISRSATTPMRTATASSRRRPGS
jgi:phosphoglucomutase